MSYIGIVLVLVIGAWTSKTIGGRQGKIVEWPLRVKVTQGTANAALGCILVYYFSKTFSALYVLITLLLLILALLLFTNKYAIKMFVSEKIEHILKGKNLDNRLKREVSENQVNDGKYLRKGKRKRRKGSGKELGDIGDIGDNESGTDKNIFCFL